MPDYYIEYRNIDGKIVGQRRKSRIKDLVRLRARIVDTIGMDTTLSGAVYNDYMVDMVGFVYFSPRYKCHIWSRWESGHYAHYLLGSNGRIGKELER